MKKLLHHDGRFVLPRVTGLLLPALVFGMGAARAQTPSAAPEATGKPGVTVIETEIGPDQIVGGASPASVAEDRSRRQVEVRFTEGISEEPNADKESSAATGDVTEEMGPESVAGEGEIGYETFIQLNAALKNAVEQNQKLSGEKQTLDREVKDLTGQKRIDMNRLSTVTVERDAYRQQAERILKIKQKLEKNVAEYKMRTQEKEQGLEEKVAALKQRLTEKESATAATALTATGGKALPAEPGSVKARQKSVDVVSLAQQLSQEKEKIRQDEGKIHYNMGNVFFHSGQYRRAADEYQRAVELMPDDPNAHFNLAFVSGQYILDQTTAVRHYKQYLRLRPNAPDADSVREKILTAELDLQSRTGSSLEKDLRDYRRGMYTYQMPEEK